MPFGFTGPSAQTSGCYLLKSPPNASGARGFVRGHFFNRQGALVATAAQECLIRPQGDLRTALELAQGQFIDSGKTFGLFYSDSSTASAALTSNLPGSSTANLVTTPSSTIMA